MNALGMIEVKSIAIGIATADAMLKVASIELLQAQPVCPGKYIILVKGSVAEVVSSVENGREVCAESLINSNVIPNIDDQVFSAIMCETEISEKASLGIIETLSIVSCIMAADTAAKAADIKLIEIRLGRGIGGKSYVILAGDVSSVKFAVTSVEDQYKNEGTIYKTTVIPSPHIDLIKALS